MAGDPSEARDVQELVERFAPELVPAPITGTRITVQALAAVATTYIGFVVSWVTLGEQYFEQAGFLGIMITCWLVGGVVAELVLRRVHTQRLREFTARAAAAPWTFFEAITERFRKNVERQRERTLGVDSEWAKARQPLKEASDEANRSAAYWRQRLEVEPDNETARSNLETAEQLERKFREAVQELDERTEVLLAFFNDCEAKLAVLEHGKRDLEESRRLAALSSRADDIVMDARATLDHIGQEFVSEAARVGRALGSLERLQLLESAGEVPLESIESVADKVLESSLHERAMLQNLSEGMTG